MRKLLALIVLLTGCGAKDAVFGPDAGGPAVISVLSASVGAVGSSSMTVNVHLKNAGGPGGFYLEFVGGGQSRTTESVNVLAGYDEAVSYSNILKSATQVRAYTRQPNSAIYSLTSCREINGTAC